MGAVPPLIARLEDGHPRLEFKGREEEGKRKEEEGGRGRGGGSSSRCGGEGSCSSLWTPPVAGWWWWDCHWQSSEEGVEGVKRLPRYGGIYGGWCEVLWQRQALGEALGSQILTRVGGRS